jgi:mutator family transposase
MPPRRFWVDGIYVQARLEDDAQCLLVIIGATAEGKKELVALADGIRESAQSWKELLLDLKRCGLTMAPQLAVADGVHPTALRTRLRPHLIDRLPEASDTMPVPRWIPTCGSNQSPMNAPITPIMRSPMSPNPAPGRFVQPTSQQQDRRTI